MIHFVDKSLSVYNMGLPVVLNSIYTLITFFYLEETMPFLVMLYQKCYTIVSPQEKLSEMDRHLEFNGNDVVHVRSCILTYLKDYILEQHMQQAIKFMVDVVSILDVDLSMSS